MHDTGQLNITAAPLPFSNKQVKAHAPVGSTVQEIIEQICPPQLKAANIGAIVVINGHQIKPKYWSRVRPKAGTIITVRIVPMGGGGGKNPLATLLSIAVMIAAPYIGAAFGTSVGLGVLGNGVLTAGQTAFFNGLVSGAVGIVGKLLISSLAPPPKPSNGGSNPAESPTMFIEGAQNALDPFGVVPVCLGTNRMVPNQCALPYTETKDNDQYVRQLFTWGWGTRITLSDQQLGDTDLADFEGYQIKHRLKGDLHLGTSLFTNDVYQQDYSVLLQEVDGYTTRTTRPDVDEATVDWTFTQGLTKFNGSGKRVAQTVQLEVQYALSGVSPQVWTTPATAFAEYDGSTLTFEAPEYGYPVYEFIGGVYYLVGYRRDIVVVDIFTGVPRIVKSSNDATTSGSAKAPAIPKNTILLATVLVLSKRMRFTPFTVTESIESIVDGRPAAVFTTGVNGVTFGSAGDFEVTAAGGLDVDVAGGELQADILTITSASAEVLRRSVTFEFPARGTYDIRTRRISADTDDDKIFDKVSLTAIKSITHQQPVNLQGINGTAIRIKATEQLNGPINQYNAIVSNLIPDYDAESDTWIRRVTSNPASIYRYVLQGAPNARPLADAKIDLDALADWHTHCVNQGYSYNRVIDYDTSVDEVLRDVAAAGAASPAIVDGKRTVVIDRIKDDVIDIITPRNSWDYSGEMIYPDMPHAFRVRFRNAEKGYLQDERIVYDDGYDATNATIFEVLELQSCTDASLAHKIARRHIASARLRPETHTFMMHAEHLVFLRGDRVKFEHDVPIIGIGDGRVKEVFTDSGSPELVTGFTIDDTVTIPSASTFYVRVRLSDGSMLYKQLVTSVGSTSTFTFLEPFEIPYTDDDVPVRLFMPDDLCYFVEAGGELDLIITRIEPQDDLTARITAINYAPEIFDAENSTIPSFDSKITTPLEFIRPVQPILVSKQSDESVMLKNSDGSFLSRAVFTLNNMNDGDIITSVLVRYTGATAYQTANLLEVTPERVILTGLEDGSRYDIQIRYRRVGGSVYSQPLEINNYLFVGASSVPAAVSNFLLSVVDGSGIFSWDANEEIDIHHYVMKYSGLYTGASWAAAQIVADEIYGNRITLPFQGGTWMIKAVDILGNESATATAIITYNATATKNVVEVLTEEPAFTGTKDNVLLEEGGIIIEDTDLIDGYYYFTDTVDLTASFVSYLSASIVANGIFVNNIYDVDDIFDELDVFGSGGGDLFDEADIFAMDDVFGIGFDGWSIELQYRVTQEDTASSPVTWGDWTPFIAGNVEFRGIQFRLKMTSLAQNVSPKVTVLSVTIDMPDRIERGDDLTCDATLGATVTYPFAFKENPAVGITIQDGATDDRIEYLSKTSSGFSFKVYNQTLAAYVTRTYDYISSGYGRENA